MTSLPTRLSSALRQPDGIAEAVGFSAVLVAATLGATVDGSVSSLTVLAASILAVWALLVAPLRPSLAVSKTLLLSVATLVTENQFPPLIALSLFLIIEVLLTNASWAGAIACSISTMAGYLLVGEWSHGMAGLLIALSVALIRRQLVLSQQFNRSQMQLELERERTQLARQLHDQLADSLTRVVLLATQPAPDTGPLAREARRAVQSLHRIMAELRDSPPAGEAQTSLRAMVEAEVTTLRHLGHETEEDTSIQQGASVTPDVADAIRELFTNALKHGTGTFRIIAESDQSRGRLLVVNTVRDARFPGMDGTGAGTAHIEATALATGGSFSFSATDSTARSVFEFPIASAPASPTLHQASR